MPSPTDAVQSLVHRMGQWTALDGLAARSATTVGTLTRPTDIKNALSGTWLGHQLHPILTDAPIGAWGAATFLDLAGGPDSATAARRLVGAGILAAGPAAVTGASDWSHVHGADRRVGLIHGLTTEAATALQAVSWVVRGTGRRGPGVALSIAALGLTGAAGYLGGHLSFSQGVGVNRTAFQDRPTSWTDVASAAQLPDGAAIKVAAQGIDVVVLRRGEELHALSNACTHDGGPLDEGTLLDGRVVCPRHGCAFRIDDGGVQRGPATVPQPVWDVRVDDGRVLVRAAAP